MKLKIIIYELILISILFSFSFSYVLCPDGYACPDNFHCCQIEKTSHYSCCYDGYECCKDGYYCCDDRKNPFKFLFHKTIELKSIETFKDVNLNDTIIIIQNAIQYLNATQYFDDIQKCEKNIVEFVNEIECFLNEIKNISDIEEMVVIIRKFVDEIIPKIKILINSCVDASIEIVQNIEYVINVFSSEEYIQKLINNILKNYLNIINDFVKYKENLNKDDFENAGKFLGIIIKDIFIV